MKLNIAYFGSPKFSARFLEKILNDDQLPVEVKMVVTQPDKPVGRSQELKGSAVKEVGRAAGISIAHSVTPEELTAQNIDLALVYAYGKIIPQSLLEAPKYGFWNIHPSLLPYYRGASPTAYALMMGEETTGCSLMQMDSGMDHGPIIAQDQFRVMENETHESLLEKLTYVGYYLFKDKVPKLLDGSLDLSSLPVQNDVIATYTRLLKRDDGFIELDLIKKALNKEKISSEELPEIMRTYLGQNTVTEFPILYAPFIVYNMFRGMQPWPGIWTKVTIAGVEKRRIILDLS